MQQFKLFKDMRATMRGWQERGEKVALVPTMGYLHEGHLSLVTQARKFCTRVICYIFVNPAQFTDPKDLERYPRDLDRDSKMLADLKVDAIFCPDTSEVYPPSFQTSVLPGNLSEHWEGEYRPGHFKGVATVLNVMFSGLRPDFAMFGEKDFQQVRVVERMVHDLRLGVELVRVATKRETDGLAMSSRNVRLSADERAAALAISRGLFLAESKFKAGERRVEALESAVQNELAGQSLIKPEYVALVREDTLQRPNEATSGCRILVAAWSGSIRLIDNLPLS